MFVRFNVYYACDRGAIYAVRHISQLGTDDIAYPPVLVNARITPPERWSAAAATPDQEKSSGNGTKPWNRVS
jgi:hypothetical protein